MFSYSENKLRKRKSKDQIKQLSESPVVFHFFLRAMPWFDDANFTIKTNDQFQLGLTSPETTN